MAIYVPIVMYYLYRCFTRTTLFTNMYYSMALWISNSTQSFVSQLCMVIEIEREGERERERGREGGRDGEREREGGRERERERGRVLVSYGTMLSYSRTITRVLHSGNHAEHFYTPSVEVEPPWTSTLLTSFPLQNCR